jgi:hypothetical protein
VNLSAIEPEDPKLTPPRRCILGMTITIFVPIDDICPRIFCFEPSPIASIAITDATPIIIPSIVRKALSLFLIKARIAILNKFI